MAGGQHSGLAIVGRGPAVPTAKACGAASPSRLVLAGLGLVLAVGLTLRVHGLGTRPLSFDEAWSWRAIQFPTDEMFTRLGRDVHPPLYYCLLKGWSAALGTSAVALR